MSYGYSFPETLCEVPKCKEKATRGIVLNVSSASTRFNMKSGSETVKVCAEHKAEFEKGKMYPLFNRLKNIEKDNTNRIFTRRY